MKNDNLHKQKKIYILLVSVFVFTGTIFIFNKFQNTSISNKDDLVIKDNATSNENLSNIDDKELETTKNMVKDFISTYYSYDKNNPQKNITDSQKYLTDDFYKELLSVDDENTRVPAYAYRKVTDIELTDAEKDGANFRYTALVKCDLLDENNKKISKLRVEFCIDLTKVNNEWKIPYFTLIGQGIEKYE